MLKPERKLMYPLLAIFLTAFSQLAFSEESSFDISGPNNTCQNQKEYLAAIYTVTVLQNKNNEKSINDNSGIKKTEQIELYRLGETIIYRYPERKLSEIWHLTKNRSLKPTQLFDHFSKGIEYEPSSFAHKKDNETRWQEKFQIIPDKEIGAMKADFSSKVRTANSFINTTQCQQIILLSKPDQKLTVQWLADAKLPIAITTKTIQSTIRWNLIRLAADEKKNRLLHEKLIQYQLTDFADIGDNESDPFFAKMIELGFIEHAASGIYRVDKQGNLKPEPIAEHEDHPLH